MASSRRASVPRTDPASGSGRSDAAMSRSGSIPPSAASSRERSPRSWRAVPADVTTSATTRSAVTT